MTPEDKQRALEAIEEIVSDDFCHDMQHDLEFDKLKTEREKEMARKLSRIYIITHDATAEYIIKKFGNVLKRLKDE